MRLEVHDVASAQPGEITVVLFMLFVLDLEKGFFSFLELLRGGRGNTKVPVEVVIIDEVGSNGLQVDKDIVELLKDEETLSHTLSSRDGVAL